MAENEKTFDELMRPTYEDVGLSGSPFAFPAFLRWFVAWLGSFDHRMFAGTVWLLHRIWGAAGRLNKNPLAQSWSVLARQYRLKDALRLAAAIKDLDQHPTFRNGCKVLNFRNCLHAMFYRGSFVDAFFRQGTWARTEFTHPHQQPSYFVPGIPSHRRYDANQFHWKDSLERSYPGIREELLAMLTTHDSKFGTFHTEFDTAIAGWNTFVFYVNGRRQDDNCVTCPRTAAVSDGLLEHEEGELTMFSALNAGSHIPPHVGPLNGILRVHLPLLVSSECGLKVGDEDITWEAGKILVFDDSFVHTVWNHGEQVRIVLFFNVWHPCLSLPERIALADLRRAYNDTPMGRNWLRRQEDSRPSTMKVAATRSVAESSAVQEFRG